ncbi:PqqD family protein [uncultured Microbacterium sp.]|uniref:PqqD family protein n=1 Tax=uncultured Microbacterium sp. TaxID=191216 RepID=UPI0028D371AC|nr:PqqD family protein [uncultured Microbacterium sp.]
MTRLATGPEVAWVEVERTVYVAVLPDPPIFVLEGTAAVIWVTALQEEYEMVHEHVAAKAGISPEGAREPVAAFIDDLRARGLLVRE